MSWTLVALVAIVLVVPLLMHAFVKRYVLASAVSALLVGTISSALFSWGRSTAIEAFAVGVAAFAAAGFLIALGIGIPFNRRRNPTPAEGLPGGFVTQTFTRRMSWLNVVVAIVFGVIFLRILRALSA